MAKARKFDLENPAPILDDEGEATLAAIDGGIRDAEVGPSRPYGESPRTPPSVDYQLLYTQRALNDLAEILRLIAARIGVSQSAL